MPTHTDAVSSLEWNRWFDNLSVWTDVWYTKKKNSRLVNYRCWFDCAAGNINANYLASLLSLTLTVGVYYDNYNKVLFCRAVTPCRFCELLLSFTFKQLLHNHSPAAHLSIMFYAWTLPVAVHFVILQKKNRQYQRSWQKVCMEGHLYSCVLCRELSESKASKGKIMGIPSFLQSYLNNFIKCMRERLTVCGVCLFLRQSCLWGEKFYSRIGE